MVLHPSQVIVSVTPLLPSDFAELPYSPVLLLDAGLDASITDHIDFRAGCRGGFESYFDEMWGDDGQGHEVFVNCVYSWFEVQGELVEMVTRQYGALERFYEQRFGSFTPLSWRAGFALGWLSALALTDYPLALRGADLLAKLVPSCRQEEAKRAACSRRVGGNGWPLDL